MSHILALQVDHFWMQNLDHFPVQLNTDSTFGISLPLRVLSLSNCPPEFRVLASNCESRERLATPAETMPLSAEKPVSPPVFCSRITHQAFPRYIRAHLTDAEWPAPSRPAWDGRA